MDEHDEKVHVLLTEDTVRLEPGVAFATLPSTGAVASFLGVTRSPGHNGKPVNHLYFESYKSMALKVLREVGREAVEAHGLSRVHISHGLGSVGLGAASLCVVVSSPHRREAFRGLEQVVDALKSRAPIFKKEVYSDGTSQWVEPHQCK